MKNRNCCSRRRHDADWVGISVIVAMLVAIIGLAYLSAVR